MDIPVYLIAGFLDAGKTSFINGILRDGFAAEDRTLLLCCEEGELGYDPHVLSNVFTYTVAVSYTHLTLPTTERV